MFCFRAPVKKAGSWGIGGAFPRMTPEDDDTEEARLADIPLSACSEVTSLELLYFALDEGVLLASFCRRKHRFSSPSEPPVSVS